MTEPRRLLVHDYAGHPFTVQLSRALAARGHQILHLYSSSFTSPRGSLRVLPDDPATFAVEGVSLDEPLRKERFVRRWRQEVEYGKRLARRVEEFRPDTVISANTPLESQLRLARAVRRTGARFVYWVQDLYGVAAHRILSRRLPIAGEAIGRYYMWLERRLIRNSDHVVLITDDFRRAIGARDERRIDVIPNWAPIEQLPSRPRDNEWSREHGLAGKTCLMYSGTLGMKHDPSLLLDIARTWRGRDDVRVVLVSEGEAADSLKRAADDEGLEQLLVLPFQPFERLPDVLASADVLLALLESDAGVFSVPSKVLSCLCAGRPLVLSVPSSNLAARIVAEAGAGLVVEPGDRAGFLAAATTLVGDPALRERMGTAGRAYAEATFDIEAIADRFEDLMRA